MHFKIEKYILLIKWLKYKNLIMKQINDWPLIKVYDSDFRQSLNDMYNVIEEKELWNYIKNNPPSPSTGYMFSNDEVINQIGNDPRVLDSGHSGATFAFAMRCMQRIANVGFDQFVKEN